MRWLMQSYCSVPYDYDYDYESDAYIALAPLFHFLILFFGSNALGEDRSLEVDTFSTYTKKKTISF
jgi:hypothetical protein